MEARAEVPGANRELQKSSAAPSGGGRKQSARALPSLFPGRRRLCGCGLQGFPGGESVRLSLSRVPQEEGTCLP